MPVFAVPRDTIDLLVSAALLRSKPLEPEPARELVRLADRLGQALWDENHAALSEDLEREIPAPHYEWQPVLELTAFTINDREVIQVERCRRFLRAQLRPGEQTLAHELLDQLGAAVANRLEAWPIAPLATGDVDYLGMADAAEQWSRSMWAIAIANTAKAG